MKQNIIILLLVLNIISIFVAYGWIVDDIFQANDIFVNACSYTIGNE